MTKRRRKFTDRFKAKVALEALRGGRHYHYRICGARRRVWSPYGIAAQNLMGTR